MAALPIFATSAGRGDYFQPGATGSMPSSPAPGGRRPHHTRSASSISMRYTPIQFQTPFEAPPAEDEDSPLEPVDLNDEDHGEKTDAFGHVLPPPPKVGEKFVTPPTPAPRRRPMNPPQMIIPAMPPFHGSHSRSSSSITTPTMPGLSSSRSSTPVSALPTPSAALPWTPAGLGHSRHVSLEHPPGYVQDVRAAELTSDQRRAREIEEDRVRRESHGSVFDAFSETMGLMGGYGVAGDASTGGAVWGAAKRFSVSATKTFEVMEKEAWRLVGGKT